MHRDRDRPGHWLAGMSPPMLAMRSMSLAQDGLAARQAQRMGMNTTDMNALRLLDLHGPLGPTELARRLDLRPASVTTLIDRLEAAGHVERLRESRDRRRVTIRARPEALQLSFDIWAPVVGAMDEIGRSLAPQEQRIVCDYLDRITAVMTHHHEHDAAEGDDLAEETRGGRA